jgi:hypothetical protein
VVQARLRSWTRLASGVLWSFGRRAGEDARHGSTEHAPGARHQIRDQDTTGQGGAGRNGWDVDAVAVRRSDNSRRASHLRTRSKTGRCPSGGSRYGERRQLAESPGPSAGCRFSRLAFRNLVNQRPRIRRACTHQYRRASAAKRRVVRSSSMSWRNQITSRVAANNVAWILGSCSADSGQRWPQHVGEATCPYPPHTTRRVVDISCATRCEAPPGSARRRRRSRWEW